MTNKEVFDRFEQIHAYSFATVDGEYPHIRIAHFLTYDVEGLYFMTMKVKPFYRQLIETKKVAVCALVAPDGTVMCDEAGLPDFPPGFHIRVSGDVREVAFDELSAKAEKDARFIPLLKDIERYPTMTTFVLYRYNGEVFDYDFERAGRDHKVERIRFGHGGAEVTSAGFTIDAQKCIACGACARVCTFSAIESGETYSIIGNRCDECGSCYTVCPPDAVNAKMPMEEEERKACGKKVIAYLKSQEK